jgi:hypothetical protein
MSTTTTAKKTATCKRCGAIGLQWKQSQRTGKWYLAEHVLTWGRHRSFRSQRLHRCLSTEPVAPVLPVTVYGRPEGPVEDPAIHEHRWLPWRNVPGGITGDWCQGCRSLIVH